MKKINIDFQIYDSRDPKTFIVLDTSEWAHIFMKRSIIEIITPGSKKPIGYEYTKNGVNIFNSLNLGINCIDCKNELIELPDGIYYITVKGTPESFNFTRSYLRTTKTLLELDNLLLQITNENINDVDNKKIIQKIFEIQLLLKSADAHNRKGDECTAQELLFKAQDFINSLKNCKNCI